MADDKVALEIFIEADKAQMSLGDLEKGFDSMKERLKEVGRGSEEFKTLSTAMANTSKEIKNIELGFEGLDREQVASELGSVAGAVGDVTASLILMGGESETMEQIGASIEKAMAISMGFKGAIEGLSSANKLYNNLLKQGKVAIIAKSVAEKVAAAGTWLLAGAQTALNAIMSANPIAIIVLAVAGLVTAFIALGGSIMGLIDTALKPFQFAIDMVVDALQFLGIMESDSAKATRKAEEEKAAATRAAVKKRLVELKKLEDANRLLTDNLVADTDFEIAKLKAKGKDTTKIERAKLVMLEKSYQKQKELQQKRLALLDEEIEKNGLFAAARTGDLFEQDKLKKDLVITEKELLETSQALELFDIEVKTSNSAKRREINKTEAEDKKKIDDKAAADKVIANDKALKLEAEHKKLLEDLEVKAITEAGEKSLAAQKLSHERAREALIEKFGIDTELMAALKTTQLMELNDLEAKIEADAAAKKLAIETAADEAKKLADKTAADERQAQREKDFESSRQLVGALSSLNSMALDNDLKNAGNNEKLKEKLRKESFEREKKLNIAMALVNGAQAQMSILAQTPKADFGIATAIAMAAAAVTTIAQIAAIKATSYQGGGSPVASESATAPSAGGAGAAGGGAAITPVSNTSTILGNQQVFVTETDITNTQNNVSVIEESATF